MKKRLLLSVILAGYLAACSSTKSPDQPSTVTTTPVVTSPDNSRNSLDWKGTYRGTLPCGDCEGIQTELKLNQDMTYEMALKYLGKSEEVYREKGPFQWNTNGNKITLSGGKQQQGNDQYQVSENMLWKLDAAGQRITGPLAEKYMLKKADFDLAITEKYWKLIELHGKPITVTPTQPREAHFILKTQNNLVKGHSGCNSFTGAYELGPANTISFTPMASTRMACQEIAYENDYLTVFGTIDNYTLKGDTLSLNKAGMAPLARFVAVYLR